jgi:hypothetical protein
MRSTKNALQLDPYEREQPSAVECSGPELAALLADLKARGAVVLGMASICVSRWRLSLEWPDSPKAGYQSNGASDG